MTVTLEISEPIESQLRERLALGDTEAAKRLLADSFAPTVEAMPGAAQPVLSGAEFERVADELADEWSTLVTERGITLADAHTSRESIYGDHP